MTSTDDAAPPRDTHAPRGRASSLRDREAYARTIREGRRLHDPAFTLHYRANRLPHARAGIGVARRVARHATERNRIKRVLRETFRAALDGLPAVDIVIIARPPATDANNAELRGALTRALRRLTEPSPST